MKISSAKDIVHKGQTILVYGDAGVGKTSLARSLRKVLVVDIDGGMATLAGEDIEYISVLDNLENLREVFDHIENTDEYETIFIDSATELEKMMLIEYGKRSKNDVVPTRNDYGIVYFKERDYLRRARNLREHGVNIVVTALEMPLELEQDEGVIRTRAYPMMGKSLAPEIVGLFDVVAHMEVSQKKGMEGKRFLRLQPTERIVAKNRYSQDLYWEADLQGFIDKIREEKEKK